jgi:hypothetical protein
VKKPKTLTPAQEVARLREDIASLLEAAATAELTRPARKKLNEEIRAAIGDLNRFLGDLDLIRQPSAQFDPSNPKVVGRFVSLALVAQPRYPLVEVPSVYGAGVYAIYYRGSFPLYSALSGSETPIYVGQAAPEVRGARTPFEQGSKLTDRLNEHRKNIAKATSTLDIADFEYRSLVVSSGWEGAAETYLIHLFRPLWNKETQILYGIGKHGDSHETRGNRRSPWDTVHPSRTWAAGSAEDAKSVHQIEGLVERHFVDHPVFPDLDAVIQSFLEELRQ